MQPLLVKCQFRRRSLAVNAALVPWTIIAFTAIGGATAAARVPETARNEGWLDQSALASAGLEFSGHELSNWEVDAIRGEQLSYGLYLSNALNASVAGIGGSVGGSFQYDFTTRSGSLANSISLSAGSLKIVADPFDFKRTVAGAVDFFRIGGIIGAGPVAELQFKVGKFTNVARNYYAELAGGFGIGVGSEGMLKVNDVTLTTSASVAATAGLWIRSTGTASQVLTDVLRLTATGALAVSPFRVPVRVLTNVRKYVK